MRNVKGQRSKQSAKEFASWTQASLLTVGSSLKSAGSSLLTGIRNGYEHLTLDHSDKERVTFVKFGHLEFHQEDGTVASCAVLLLGYEVGFQIWSLKEAVKEVASRRDGRIRCLESLPLPLEREQSRCQRLSSWPLVAVIAEAKDGTPSGQHEFDEYLVVSYIKLYSLQSHSYVHSIAVPGNVLSVSCSRRVLLVAMSTQIMAYDLATMDVTYSAITYPALAVKHLGDGAPAVPLALGNRWLAHASNQPVHNAAGVAMAQPISNSHSWGPQAANSMEAVQHYAALAAKTSGKHIKNLGEASYKYLSSQVENLRNGSAPVPSSPSSTSTQQPDDSEIVGTVIVRDMVDRTTLVHFRAHTSPLLLLRFDGSGTLLVTASVHGHTVNVFHITPGGGGLGDSAAHLFRLSRGVTPAVIQDVAFSGCGHWLCVSSARGTTHVFRLSIPGKSESIPPHMAAFAISSSDRRRLRPVKLQAAGRARPGGILNGSLPGSAAAAAAVNLCNGASGGSLMACSFTEWQQDKEGGNLYASGEDTLTEDLFVASNDGLLVRHQLSSDRFPSPPVDSSTSQQADSREEGSAELAVEAVEQWDVCRRQSWPEREELLCEGSEGKEADVEQHLPWSAFAETRVPSGQLPLWADSQFHILEMQTGGAAGEPSQDLRGCDQQGLAGSTILQVEEVPTKRINARGRGGLAPVIIEGAETAVLRGAHSSGDPKHS